MLGTVLMAVKCDSDIQSEGLLAHATMFMIFHLALKYFHRVNFHLIVTSRKAVSVT